MLSTNLLFKCSRMDCHHRIRWTLYSFIAIIIIFLSVSEVQVFSSVKRVFMSSFSDGNQQKYIIVFDGGSTGTRIHVFSFANSTEGNLILQDEYFEETKPGLSSYANKPRNAATSVKILLDKAQEVIPSHHWTSTPVMVKATAGLRLLPTHKSNMILDEVSRLIKTSPFYCEKNCVSVLDGEDEGLFAWFTLNFLLDLLHEPNQSVGLLDLGGGSTQVTFVPSDFDSLVTSPNGYIINRRVHSKTLTIYSHSYLGLGLMSARLAILRSTTNNSEEENRILRSPCISPDVKATWVHGMTSYQVTGVKPSLYSFEECYQRCTDFLKNSIHKPEELSKREVYAISYYFDRAVDIGMINRTGGIVTLRKWIEFAEMECATKQPRRPFLCFDTSYIIALLKHGLGFVNENEIKLVQEIDGIETSWGLGAAFSLLN